MNTEWKRKTNQKNSWNNFIPDFEYELIREYTPSGKFILSFSIHGADQQKENRAVTIRQRWTVYLRGIHRQSRLLKPLIERNKSSRNEGKGRRVEEKHEDEINEEKIKSRGKSTEIV